TAFLPGIGAQYTFWDSLSVLAGVHRGFSPVAPGQSVKPEYSVNYEAGTRYFDKAHRSAELIGFFNDYSNVLGECSVSEGCTQTSTDLQFNGGKAHVYGIEIGGGDTFDLGRKIGLPVRVAYTFMRSSFRSDFQSQNPFFGDVHRGDELPYLPRHQLAVHAG